MALTKEEDRCKTGGMRSVATADRSICLDVSAAMTIRLAQVRTELPSTECTHIVLAVTVVRRTCATRLLQIALSKLLNDVVAGFFDAVDNFEEVHIFGRNRAPFDQCVEVDDTVPEIAAE